MTGMTSCREIRHALGVYVLGAIEPAERAQVEAHLATCPDCREELAGLAGLPAMLRKVPVVEAERLAATDTELDAGELLSEEMLESLVARTANVRRMHRWRRVAAAAAVIVVAAGGGAAVATALQPSAPSKPHSGPTLVVWHMATGTGPRAGVHLTVRYRGVRGGTLIEASVTGIAPGTQCQFQATDASYKAWPLGGWVWESRESWFPASIWLGDKDLRSFEVLVNNKVVASAPT